MPGFVPPIVPPPIAPGDRIAVVAPCGALVRDATLRGLAWLAARYRMDISAGVFERDGYLAGNDGRRAAELAQALEDDSIRAIVVARGGYGSMRLIDAVPWRLLAHRPKWLIGFSDVTAIHVAAASAGVCSVHGPNVTGLGVQTAADVRLAWLQCVECPTVPRAWRGLRVVRGGEANGAVAGGNLTLLHAMAAAGRSIVPKGCILLLEDVSEAPYRVDRMLTSLRLGGHLARAAAIVFGSFTRCDAASDGRTVEQVVAERTADLAIPILCDAPFGHGTTNRAFILGRSARVTGDSLVFE